ncbi:4-(cytidine 5'-diphospho)-2-C-methyl-D-erythritol kinase [Neorhizobium sp. NCHU2750]|uniref:4-(cytidine 5'-diphospho)-2-C-methyl-D-erythritol kinase n=1 Tax=Neorhizobium sp. NCHU2750 TaxID=1825976 RepID=UPI000E752B8E
MTRPAGAAGLFQSAAQDGAVTEFAPAKINLALHVVGQRADGYHLLEMIVTFMAQGSAVGDVLHFTPAESDSFSVSGRFGAELPVDAASVQKNLVVRARDLMRAALRDKGMSAPQVAIHLEKNLPIASGIGGGSADAAATLRGLLRLWRAEAGLSDSELAALALSLGADVPMCLKNKPAEARGIGEDLVFLDSMPSFPIVIGNPLLGVSTPDIFRRLATKTNAPIPPLTGDWRTDLSGLRNDLEPPAAALLGEIDEISAMIANEGAWLTRMSGSGATCFGLFDTAEEAGRAAERLQAMRPDWYFAAAETTGRRS